MKKGILLGFGFALCALVIYSFKIEQDSNPNSLAEVEQIRGLYVFIHAKPKGEYQYLGSYAPAVVWTANAEPLINHMIKKGKEMYPQANAIIFTDDDLDRVDLIQLK
jgi:hypothetical protein